MNEDASTSVIVLDDRQIAIWSFGFYGGDWLCGLRREDDNEYHLNYRFKYYEPGTLPFDPNDRRSDYSFSIKTDKSPEVVYNEINQLVNKLYTECPKIKQSFT